MWLYVTTELLSKINLNDVKIIKKSNVIVDSLDVTTANDVYSWRQMIRLGREWSHVPWRVGGHVAWTHHVTWYRHEVTLCD